MNVAFMMDELYRPYRRTLFNCKALVIFSQYMQVLEDFFTNVLNGTNFNIIYKFFYIHLRRIMYKHFRYNYFSDAL